MADPYRVAVIGSTGQGNYGHGLDTAFQEVERARLVAVADRDAAGRRKAAQRMRVNRTYADYRMMLRTEKPDIVCVGPRWLTQRADMVIAAAEMGCHIYCEKPFAADLEQADRMADAVRKAGVKLAMAHQWRAMPPVQKAIRDIRSGRFGRLLRIRARPKDDRRGGGEELLLHGTHLFDMMLAITGDPQWVTGHIQSGGRDVNVTDRREASEPIGPVAGDSIDAMYGFQSGVRGFFVSTAGLSVDKQRQFDNLYGVFVECERACIQLRQPGDMFVYEAPRVLADADDLKWTKVWIEDWHFTREHKPRPIRRLWLQLGNKQLATDLIDAIQRDRTPLSGLERAVTITEMVQGVYRSHFDDGRRITIPSAQRRHPLVDPVGGRGKSG